MTTFSSVYGINAFTNPNQGWKVYFEKNFLAKFFSLLQGSKRIFFLIFGKTKSIIIKIIIKYKFKPKYSSNKCNKTSELREKTFAQYVLAVISDHRGEWSSQRMDVVQDINIQRLLLFDHIIQTEKNAR